MARIHKIRRQAILMSIEGADVLFVADNPDSPVGNGASFLFGSMNETPSAFLCARRLLNELKCHMEKNGFEFDYTLSQKERRPNEQNEVL